MAGAGQHTARGHECPGAGCDPHRLGMAGAGFPPPYRFFRETYSCDPHRLGMAGAGRPRYRCVAAEYMLRSSPAWNGRCWAPPPAVEDTMPKVAILTGLEWPVLGPARSEEHTSELQSRSDLVCRLLL